MSETVHVSKRFFVGVLVGAVLASAVAVVVVLALGAQDDGETAQPAIDDLPVADHDGDDAPSTTAGAIAAEPVTRPEFPAGAPGSVRFFCDFTEPCDLDQFVQYRDSFVVAAIDGRADHAIAADATAENPLCTAPEETRTWSRSEPFGLTYRCIPGGNLDAAHQMSVVPDTAGYSFTGSSPNLVFEDVERISFTVNMTSAGERNFWEVAVIPAEGSWVDAMPCIPDVPCNDGYDYDSLGAVGFGNFETAGSGFQIGTATEPDGYSFDAGSGTVLPDGSLRYAPCDHDDFCFGAFVHGGQIDVRARYAVVIEERADGLWFGQEAADGTMHWAVLEGEYLPEGPVRVVLKFHGYTPTKSDRGPGFDGNLSASVAGFTWHWDDVEVVAGAAVASADYYGSLNPERFTTASAAGCLAFAQGQRDHDNRTVMPLMSCPSDMAGSGVGALYGPIDELLHVG